MSDATSDDMDLGDMIQATWIRAAGSSVMPGAVRCPHTATSPASMRVAGWPSHATS
jgi:hypothetical protein